MTDIYAEILKWSKSKLPAWQQDALRRIVLGQLDERDYADLVKMAKAASGIASAAADVPLPLNEGHLSRAQGATEPVVLCAISDVTNANALAPGQTLTIGRAGITVIYGENGSGKTGYSRILRHACRARRAPKILSNVSKKQAADPEAKFTVSVDGAPEKTVLWKANEVSPDELAALSVFNRDCERSFIEEEGELKFVPPGLDVFQQLVEVIAQVKRRVAEEEVSMRPQDTLEDFRRVTATSSAISLLLSGIDAGHERQHYEGLLQDVDALCATDQQMHELKEIERRLDEININDPTKRAARLRTLAATIDKTRVEWEQAARSLNDDAMERLRGLLGQRQTTREAVEELSRATLVADVPGFGTDTWKALYAAAVEYATKCLHPGVDSFDTEDVAKCPLCRQRLSESAKERFSHFRQYMTGEAERIAREAERGLAAAKQRIESVSVQVPDESVLQQLDDLYAQALVVLRSFPLVVMDRREKVLEALGSEKWGNVPGLQVESLRVLQSVCEKLRVDAQEVEDLADPEARTALEKTKNELVAKVALRRNRERVCDTVMRHLRATELNRCHEAINTNSVTSKGKALAALALTKDVKDAFNEEMCELGAAGRISISIGQRGDRGRSLYRLGLDGDASRYRASDVLSESEQRVVALAYFLAEARLAPSPIGIVVDDPVSSLDHRWSDAIAQRLVGLARHRQVIVLTHDISFYIELEACATEQRVEFHPQFLVRKNRQPGHCDISASPSERLGVGARMDALSRELPDIKKLYEDDPDGATYRLAAEGFRGRLRNAWERAVEEVVFNGVVERFGHSVKTQSLKGVVCDDDTFQRVYYAMKRLSSDVHDGSARKVGGSPRRPEQLRDELKELQDFVGEHKRKKKSVVKDREQLGEPPLPESGVVGRQVVDANERARLAPKTN